MKSFVIYIAFLFFGQHCFAQGDFTGIVKYRLSVLGGTDKNTDSMCVVFDKDRVLVILYLPDGNKVSERKFIDDFKDNKTYRLDPDKQTYETDSLKKGDAYTFIIANSIGAVNNELCMKYKAKLEDKDKSQVTAAECLASINFRSPIQNYSFLGVQPMIVDNRIVMDYTVMRSNGSTPTITVYDIRRMDDVSKYFDLWGYIPK